MLFYYLKKETSFTNQPQAVGSKATAKCGILSVNNHSLSLQNMDILSDFDVWPAVSEMPAVTRFWVRDTNLLVCKGMI